MKRINKILVVGLLMTTFAGGGCKKAWFDINKDPNTPVESNITPELVLPPAMLTTANRVGTSYGFLGHWMSYWAPAANYAPGVEEQSYNITTTFAQGLFANIMDNSNDYKFMERSAAERNLPFYQGIGKIMLAHNFANLVDLYNDVPYSEALQSLVYPRPKYDDAKTIYEDLIKQIDTGMALIKGAVVAENPKIESTDIMFGGHQSDWAQFGNTLKLRLLMHQASRADRTAYITAELAKIQAEGSGFLGSGHDASVAVPYSADKPNAYYASYGFNIQGNQATDFTRANYLVMDSLKRDVDPRLGYFYKPVVTPRGTTAEAFTQLAPETYRGNKYGLPIDNTTYPAHTANYVSQVGGIAAAGPVTAASTGLVKGFNQRAWILTSVESLFLQAEAIERGLLTGDKKTAYKNAVKESFLWLNVGGSAAAATTAFNNWYDDAEANLVKSVSYDAAPDKLRLLQYQKHLAMNGSNHLEAWVDYRRNGNFPNFPLSANPGRTSSTIPYRLLYPQREVDVNTASVPNLGIKSGDQFTGKIWWMP